jgi:DNA-binding response OmpR family regulator
VNDSVALLTSNNELFDDLKNNLADVVRLIAYRSVDAVRQDNYDALLIDIEAVNADSVQFYLSKIRKKIQDLPVMLVLRSAHCEYMRRDWFIDDFIVYPFRRSELTARLARLMWSRRNDSDVITIGNIQIDLGEYAVYLDNQKLALTYKEFELLRLFMQNRGIVFSRTDLLGKIWGIQYIGGTRTVDVHIRRLRGKLGDGFDSVIETVRNVGYRCRE